MKAKAQRTLRSRIVGVLLAMIMLFISIPSISKTSAYPGFGGQFGPIVLTNASVEFKDSKFQSISEVDSGSLFYLMITISGNNVNQNLGAANKYRVYITDNNLLLPNFAGNGFVDGATYNGYTLHINADGIRYIEFTIANGETKAIRLQAKFANGTTPDDTENVVKLVQVSTGKSVSNTITANSSIQWSASKAEDRTQLKAADVASGTTVNYTLNASPSNPTAKTGAWWLEGLEYNDTITLTDAAFASGAESAITSAVKSMLESTGYKYDSVSVTVSGSSANISFKVYSNDVTSEMTAPSLKLTIPINSSTVTLKSGTNAVLTNSLNVIGKPINGDGFTYNIGGNDVSLNIEAPQGPKFSISKAADESQILYSGSTERKITYTITVSNYGDEAGDITIKDVPKTDGLSAATDTYVLENVNPGETRTITVECSLDETALSYTGNIASVCNRAQDEDDDSNYSDAYITVEKAEPNLNVYKYGYADDGEGHQKQTFSPGETVQYFIKITNNGKADAKDVTFEDIVDSNLQDLTTTNDVISISGNTVSGTISEIAAGEEYVVNITGTIKSDTTAESISNIATVDGKKTNEVVFTRDSASISCLKTGYVGESGNLFYTGDGSEEAVYVITVKNNGAADAEGVIVKDTLPEGFIAESYQIGSNGESAFTGSNFEASVDVPKNSSVEITIKGKIKENCTGEIKNTAAATYNGETSNTGTVSFNEASGNIGINKTVEPGTFYKGTETEVTWKIYVSNTGSAKAENVKITDEVPANATFTSYSIESNIEGNSVSTTNLDGALELSNINLEKGESIVISINGTVSGTENVTNTAKAVWDNNEYTSSAVCNAEINPNSYIAEKWIVDAEGNTLVDSEGNVAQGFDGFSTSGGQTIIYRMSFENNSGETIEDLQISDYCYWSHPKTIDEVLNLKVVESVKSDLKAGQDISRKADGFSDLRTSNGYWYINLTGVNLQSGGKIVIEYTTTLYGVGEKDDCGVEKGSWGLTAYGNTVGFSPAGSYLNSSYYKSATVYIPWSSSFGINKSADTSSYDISSSTYDELKKETYNYTISLVPNSSDSYNYSDNVFTITDELPDGMEYVSGSAKVNDNGELSGDVIVKGNTIIIPVKSKIQLSGSDSSQVVITYSTKLTNDKAQELAETGEEVTTLTNTITNVVVTDTSGNTVKDISPNTSADISFKKVMPAPGFAKIAYASFAGTEYSEELLQPVENGLITAGDTLIWQTVVYNGNGDESEYNSDNTAALKGYSVTDTLPSSYSLDTDNITGYPKSIKIYPIDNKTGKPDLESSEVTVLDWVDPAANGKNYTWNFDGDAYALEPNKCLVIEFATIADVDVEGVVTNIGYVKIDQTFTVENVVAGEKKDDTITNYANYNIAGLTTESWKTIHYENEGHTVAGGDLHDDPITDDGEGRNPQKNYVQGMQGEKVTYTINVKNNSPLNLENMSIIDRLPYEGDAGLVSGYERNSAFSVNMGSIESVKIGDKEVPYTVSYSSNKDAVLDEYSNDWIGQDDEMTWTDTVSSSTVNFRVIIDSSVVVEPEQTVTITFTGYVPEYVANTGKENIAWNSFAYSYQNSTILPGTVMVAEPAKVGVWVETPTAANSITINKTLEGTTGGTYYFALFDNQDNRVSDIVSMVLDADATEGQVTMENLDFNQINNGNNVYIWETDSKGNILEKQTASPYTIKYSTNEIDTSQETQTVDVTNTLNVGDITVTKKLSANTAKTDTFYFALFTKDGDKFVRYENAAVKSLSLSAKLNSDGTAYEAADSVVFKDVPKDIQFYVLETNENGVLTSDNPMTDYTSVNGNSYTVQQEDKSVEAGENAAITNTENTVYSITVMKVLSSDDIKTTPKFNVGLFTKDGDSYSKVDTKEVVSGSEVKFDDLDPATVYYVFEIDEDGKILEAGDELKVSNVSLDSKTTADKKFIVSYDGCGTNAIQFADASDSSKSVIVTNTDTPENESLNKLTVTKSVVDENGLIDDYSGKFYFGLYTYEVDDEGQDSYEFVESKELDLTNGTGSIEFTGLKADSKTVYVVYELESKNADDSPYMDGYAIKVGEDNFIVSYPSGSQAILEAGVPGTLRVVNTKSENPALSFIKADINGVPYEGAKLTLIDADGNIKDTWTTASDPHIIEGLADGTYNLSEELISGYASLTAEVVIKDGFFDLTSMDDSSYAVNSTSLTVYNRSVLNVSKVDIDDNTTELAGAKIQITLNDDNVYLSGTEVSRAEEALTCVSEFSENNAENGYNEYIITEGKTIVFFSDGKNDTVLTGLPDGNYTMTEEIAPDGYTVAESYSFSIENGIVNSSQSSSNYEIISASGTANNEIIMKDSVEKSISISKQDIAGIDGAEVPGAEIHVILDEGNLDAESIKLTRANAQGSAETLVIDKDYKIDGGTIIFTSADVLTKIYGLPDGSYTLHEEIAPSGYQVVTDFEFELENGEIITIQPDDRDDIALSSSELVVKDSASEVNIDKRDVTGEIEIDGAVLNITVKELADGVSVDWTKISENASIEVTPVNEGADGVQNGIQWKSAKDSAQTIKYLPDGTYTLKESGSEFEYNGITYAVLNTTAEFTIKDGKISTNIDGAIDGMATTYPGEDAETGAYVYDNGTIYVCDAVAAEKYVSVNISKKDIAGDEITGASLRVYYVDEDGIEKNVDEWISNSEEHKIENLVPDQTYILEETSAPNGYSYAESIEFSVNAKGEATVSENGEADENGTLIMRDDAIEDISISKRDVTLNDEVAGASLVLYEIGENSERTVVDSWTSGDKAYVISGSKLKAEAAYILEETNAPEGYAYAADIEFTIDRDGNIVIDKEYIDEDGSIIMADEEIENIKIGKRDISGQEKVSGAVLQILDENRNVIEEWTSNDDDHLADVTKLSADKTYILHEEGAPEGYIYAADIEFTINRDGKVEVDETYVDENGIIIMVDDVTKVVLSKIDATNSNEIEGAELELYQVTDKDGKALDEEKLVDKWTSGDDGMTDDGEVKPHEINGELIAGAEYRLIEITAPNGYQKAEDVTFTVLTDGSLQKVVMQDSPKGTVAISKQDINSTDELIGAVLQILDEKGNIVEEWISGSDTVSVTDENGDAVEKAVSHSVKLEAGTYTLREITAPEGYLAAEEMTFSVDKDGATTVDGIETGTIVMKDDYIKVHISKTDITGDKEIQGASLELRDSNGNLIDSWVSNGTVHEIDKLASGEYTLHEEGAPDGYAYSEDITFTVTETSEIQTVTMKDKALEVTLSKKALTGDDELPGAILELYQIVTDDEGSESRVLVDRWESAAAAHEITIDSTTAGNKNLVAGGKYVMVETRAPEGYQVAEEITFTIEKDGSITGNTVMRDSEINQLGISKVDILGDEVAGAHLQIFDSDDNLIEEWNSTAEPHIVKLEEGVYTLKEEAAPHGYIVATEITFAIDANGNATVDGKDAKGLIKMTDDISTISIVKVGEKGEETVEISGAAMKLTYNGDGNLDLVIAENGTITKDNNVITWLSGDTAVKLQRIPNGSYVLEEIQAPDGYEITTQITFDVINGKVTNVVIDEKGKSVYSNGVISMFDALKPVDTTTEDTAVVTTEDTTIEDTAVVTTEDTTTEDTAVVTTEDTTTEDTTTVTTKNTTTEDTTTVTTKNTTTEDTTTVTAKDTTTESITTTASTAGPTTTSEISTTISTIGPTTPTATSTTTTSEAITTVTTKLTFTETYFDTTTLTGNILAGTTSTTVTTSTTTTTAASTTTTATTTAVITTTASAESTQQVQIAKREIVGGSITGAEVIGAYLKVTAEDSSIIDSWISDGTFHNISGLKEGVTYTLSETAPPSGYYYASSIQFTVLSGDVYIVNRDGSLSIVTDGMIVMYDELIPEQTVQTTTTTSEITTIESLDTDDTYETSETTTETEIVTYDIDISKQEIVNDAATGRELPGAMLQISTAEGTIAQWISGSEPYRIYGLIENVVYTLTEVQSPEDYALAESIDFMISNGTIYIVTGGQSIPNVDMTVVMYDKYAPATSSTTTTISTTTTTTAATTASASENTTSGIETTTITGTTGTTAKTTTTTTKKNNTSKVSSYTNSTNSPKTQDTIMSVAGIGSSVFVLVIAAGMIIRKKK